MKIVVDNGGTKSDWGLIPTGEYFTANSINVFGAERDILVELKKNLENKIFHTKKCSLHFYTYGATESVVLKLKAIFKSHFPNIHINIYSDMLGASRALFQKTRGIACILGTGSNCAYYDGEKNHHLEPSLGYLFGDEGSGYFLGKSILGKYFKAELSIELNQSFEEYTTLDREQLLSKIYSSSNPRFLIASFSKFLKKNESNPQVQAIIFESIDSFLTMYPLKYLEFYANKIGSRNVGFVGSISLNFTYYIEKIMKKHDVYCAIVDKPIQGLIKYYQ